MVKRLVWGGLMLAIVVATLYVLVVFLSLVDVVTTSEAEYGAVAPFVEEALAAEAPLLVAVGVVLFALIIVGAWGAAEAGRKALVACCLVGVLLATSGCGSRGLGGKSSRVGDGQIDVLKILAIAGGIQSGDAGPLCQTTVAGQSGVDEATAGLLLAACRGLLGQQLGAQSPFAPRSVVAGTALPAGGACDEALAEVQLALDLAASACGR